MFFFLFRLDFFAIWNAKGENVSLEFARTLQNGNQKQLVESIKKW